MQSNSNVGGGSFLAYEDSGRMFYHSLPACAFFFFFFRERETISRTLLPLIYARISPQWLSELRRHIN